MKGLWILLGVTIPTGLAPAIWRLTQLFRNRNQKPGDDTLWDARANYRAKAEMMVRQRHPNRNRTSKL